MILASSYPYTGNGLGGLPDALEATVTHEINGIYEFFMRYPVTGLHYEELISGRIIMAKPDDMTDEQPFRIYRITKPLNGIVSVYARHFCYDMQGIIVEPFTAGSLTEAFTTIPTVCTPSSPITLSTTRSVASGITLQEPRPLWKLLGGQAGSLLDVYGGEWDFDKDEATFVTRLGADRGVSIRYGKNMTELEQDANIESCYSAVFPFWYDEESNTYVSISEKTVPVAGSVVSDRVMILDCSDDFDDAPTQQDLRDRANAYITANSIGNVKASWKISFVDTTEGLDRIMLGDTLHVYYERLDVNATARAVKVEFDVLQGRYKSITVGKVKQNLAAIIAQQNEAIENAPTQSDLEKAQEEATDFIRNGAGYMRTIYNSSDQLTEIVSLDDTDIAQAQSVWRWNNGGFGHSSNGYNGTYTVAITQNGAIVADFITAGTLNANVIRAGILQDALGKNAWNLATGAFTITNGTINVNTASDTQDMIQFNWTNSDGDIYRTSMSSAFHSVMMIPQGSLVPTEETNLGAYGLFLGRYYKNGAGLPAAQVHKGGFVFWQNYDRDKWSELTQNTLSLYDSSVTLRTKMDGEGKLWQYDANGKQRTYLEYGDIMLYTSAEKQTVKLSGAAFPTLGGSLQLYDTNANERVRLHADGLRFYNASGTEVAPYLVTNTLSDMTFVSSRVSNVLGGAYKQGTLGMVCFTFQASVTASNSPQIATCSFDPVYDCALSCIDITSGISSAITDAIPCGISYNGRVYVKTITTNHIYAVTGVFPIANS